MAAIWDSRRVYRDSSFYVSMIGIVLGVVVGVLTVLIAAHSPAKRAAKVSPATAVSGNVGNTNKGHRTRFIGFIKIDTALGINHAVSARKNLILMTGSFALSIILFFGFSAGLDFAKPLYHQQGHGRQILRLPVMMKQIPWIKIWQ